MRTWGVTVASCKDVPTISACVAGEVGGFGLEDDVGGREARAVVAKVGRFEAIGGGGRLWFGGCRVVAACRETLEKDGKAFVAWIASSRGLA